MRTDEECGNCRQQEEEPPDHRPRGMPRQYRKLSEGLADLEARLDGAAGSDGAD